MECFCPSLPRTLFWNHPPYFSNNVCTRTGTALAQGPSPPLQLQLLCCWRSGPSRGSGHPFPPSSSSSETQDQYSHAQLKVPAPFPPQIRFPPRFCFAGTELLIGFVLLIFQLPQIWAGSVLPTRGGGMHGTPGTRTCLPASLHPLIPAPAPAAPSQAQPGVALEGAGQPPPRQNNPHGQIMVMSNLLGLCKSPLG